MRLLLYFFLSICLPLFSVEIHCPKKSLFVQELDITVDCLEPSQEVVIELSTVVSRYVKRVASAHFVANDQGVVSLSTDAPTTGSYEGVDSMGLFWSMQSIDVLWYDAIAEREGWLGPYLSYDLKVFSEEGELLASQLLHRMFDGEEIERIIVYEDGLIGVLYLPKGGDNLPITVVLTGSNGGIPNLIPSMLSAEGIPTFALAYSGIGHLPESVEDVQIEYLEKAFDWIQNHPRLNGRIALHGTSRGAELALLLGSMFPDRIERIISVAPSCVVLSKDSWFYGGESILPAAPFFIDLNNDYDDDRGSRENPITIRHHRERGFILERERLESAMIPVEKIQCPILLISGGDDQVGPCTWYAEMVIKRLEENESETRCYHLDYPFAGHNISIPYLPQQYIYFNGSDWWNYGGTPYYNEMASRDSWKKTVQFLKEWMDE